MSQPVPELRTLWRLMKSSFTVLVEDFEENPSKFGIEGLRSLRNTIDSLLLDPQGFTLATSIPAPVANDRDATMPVQTQRESSSIGSTRRETVPTNASTAMEETPRVWTESRKKSTSSDTGVSPDSVQAGDRADARIPQHELITGSSSHHNADSETNDQMRRGSSGLRRVVNRGILEEVDRRRGYSKEEQDYIAAAWNRVARGEIERAECAAEVAEVLGRTKAAIQGQFTWLKLAVPRRVAGTRGRARPPSSGTPSTSQPRQQVSSSLAPRRPVSQANANAQADDASLQSSQQGPYNTMTAPRRRKVTLPYRYRLEGMNPTHGERERHENIAGGSDEFSDDGVVSSQRMDSGDEDWMAEDVVVAKKRQIGPGAYYPTGTSGR